MSLAKVVAKIVERMERTDSICNMQPWIDQLKIALEAAEGEQPTPQSPLSSCGHYHATAEAAVRCMAGNQLVQKVADKEESNPGMVYLVGGSHDGAVISVDPAMPVGAFSALGSEVYQLGEDRKLHFNEEQTKKLKERKNG